LLSQSLVKMYITSLYILIHNLWFFFNKLWGRRDRVRMVIGFTTTYAINVYHH